jgi:hypothetical protein
MASNQYTFVKSDCSIDYAHSLLPFWDPFETNIKGAHKHGKVPKS